MAGKGVSGGNSLTLLLGDYNSDSENDDTESSSKQMDNKLQEFLSDLNTTATTNWTQCIDQSTGHPYYWNILTKDVTWDMPPEYKEFQKQNVHSSNSKTENSYTVCYTDDKVPYYVNEFTRQVSWEKPPGFVEPVANLGKNVKKSKKEKNNTVADRDGRNGHKKKSKKPEKVKKKYPFAGDDELDHVKIELISSFATKSDSSSEDEVKSKKPKTSFNLVANDYDSDDNIDSETKDTNDKPLFASSLLSNASMDSSAVKIYSLKTDLIDRVNPETTSPIEEPEPVVVERPTSTISKANTFASIITGGRSPNDQQNELMELMKPEVNESESQSDTISPGDQPIEMDVKSFKRKRRIEFMTRPVAPAKVSTECVTNDLVEKDSVNSSVATKNDESSSKPMYSNFLRGNVEFSAVTDENNSEKVSVKVIDAELDAQKSAISDLRSIIESKLKFLCNGRPDVSAVQAIFIQFETLLEAYDNQALQPAYIQRWLDGISTDLSTLENDAAPSGWKCLWNRKKSQYCYKNLTTGDIRWEYPENDSKSDEAVEMDICTTPPPNVDEQFKMEQSMVNPICLSVDDNATAYVLETGMPQPPPPPNISFSDDEQPPPPGTDLDSNKDNPSEKINSELATFYSEMASIDTNSTPATELPTSSSEPVKVSNETASTDSVAKKKKKKIKKSEPWRSGNLETWINKWQKAQKELDG